MLPLDEHNSVGACAEVVSRVLLAAAACGHDGQHGARDSRF
jgi:hypothetical protein